MEVSIILAAGQGKRMKSDKAKVLHEVLGRPMLFYVLNACKESNIEKNLVVIGNKKEQIKEAFKEGDSLKFIAQPMGNGNPYGTGFAVSCCLGEIDDDDNIIILNGDTPLINSKTIDKFLSYHRSKDNDLTVLTADLCDPTNYGRIIRDGDANVKKIVEHKDATEKEKLVREINSGIFAFKGKALKHAISKIDADNAQHELYLTDTLKILVEENKKVGTYKLKDTREILGVNSRADLAYVEENLRDIVNYEYMINGVTLINPKQTYIEYGACIETDVTIYPNSYIDKGSHIETGSQIKDSKIINSHIGKNVKITTSLIEESSIGDGTTVGPNAHLRPNSKVGKNCKVGNFVEIKNANIGDGTKMSHLAYIGDADIGANVNIGCGVIFVNYDGKKKYRTKVGDHAFIGSNSNLVAPIEVEEYGYIAAGSTITKKVFKGQLSLERNEQKNIDGWVSKKGFDK